MTFAPSRLSLSLTAMALSLSLMACGDKGDKKVATQVAAKVGSEEISVHQINQVLQATGTSSSPEATQTMGREVLEKLIDQQLAVDQAIDAKLHRAPEVVNQIEAARREILARAYMQKVVAALPKPNPEEIKAYYKDQPALFSERRVYNLQELVIPKSTATADIADELKTRVTSGKSMEDTAAWLKSRNIQFGGGRASRAAEQIPLELLSQLHALKDGQSTVVDAPQAFTVVNVVSSQLAPVPEADALPRIEQFLTNRQATNAITADLKRLRAATPVTYMGDFSSLNNTSEAQEKPASSAIDKGVAGLK